jgi:hypothetical protein
MSFDAAYFNKLAERIDHINGCGELQECVDEAFAAIQHQFDDITANLAVLQPLLALLTLSITDLPGVINAVKSIITNLVTPYVKPYLLYVAQIVELTTAVTNLTTAIENAAGRITSCSITIPPLTPPTP